MHIIWRRGTVPLTRKLTITRFDLRIAHARLACRLRARALASRARALSSTKATLLARIAQRTTFSQRSLFAVADVEP